MKKQDTIKLTITISKRDVKVIDAMADRENRTRAGICRDWIRRSAGLNK